MSERCQVEHRARPGQASQPLTWWLVNEHFFFLMVCGLERLMSERCQVEHRARPGQASQPLTWWLVNEHFFFKWCVALRGSCLKGARWSTGPGQARLPSP